MEEKKSPSSRRAWIEILMLLIGLVIWAVALLAEGVDRNVQDVEKQVASRVALLAEGVDRNIQIDRALAVAEEVALLAEGVDRNSFSGS